MKKVGIVVVSLILLSMAAPSPGEAQSRLGGFLDWIHKLSGPRMVGVNISYIHELEDGKYGVRVGGALRSAVEGPDDIDMYSVQGQLDWYWGRPANYPIKFGSGVGLAAHYFTSDAPSFWHWSVPVYPAELTWHAVDRLSWGMDVMVDLGVHLFPPFDAGDFGSLNPGVSTEDWEYPFAALVGLEFSF